MQKVAESREPIGLIKSASIAARAEGSDMMVETGQRNSRVVLILTE
jgi:hypothetical protein